MTFPISQYLNVRMAYGPSIRSDGLALAFLSNIVGFPQVWQTPLDSDVRYPLWPDQRTFGNERIQGAWFSPAPGDKRLIYSRDTGGNENAQLFLLDHDGSVTTLTTGFEHVMHMFGDWSPDGSQIVFGANRRKPGLFDLYLQPLGEDVQLIWQNEVPGYLMMTELAPALDRLVVARMVSSFQVDLFEIDLASREARQLTATDATARYYHPHYSEDGRSLYLLTDYEADFMQLAQLDLDTLALNVLDARNRDCEFLTISPDRRRLAYCVNKDGASQVVLRDVDTGGFRYAPLGDAPGVVGFFDGEMAFAPDSSGVAFSMALGTRTADVHYWDFGPDKLRAVTRSSHGGLPLKSFHAPQLIRYPTFDEREIPAWYYRAENGSDLLPAVVLVHGGPEGQYRPTFDFLAQFFIQHGFAVLAPNVRGSTGYGKEYSHLDDVQNRMNSVEDLAAAARWLQRQPGIDRERLVVYGGSYGGFMVLATLTTHPELWAAGVNIVGISNFVTFLENTSEYRRAHREAEYGSLEKDREFLESIAPINHLDQICAPLMVIHGANDPRVPISEAEQLVAALRTRDVPVEFLVFGDEGHGLVRLKNKLVAYPAVVAFLEKYLVKN